ncbi:MAG TPA: T9SS type A sorting domain-containing protein, partial [Salinimicrobium sp.]|nr:T9SS type A sorting domain-containing protein [Salinimicrobium sp.]
AYTVNPSLEGEATFGFVSKYKKGANVPDGRTEFEFSLGHFSFESTSYEWLIVAGTKAMFKGEGIIDGQPGIFGFMISAIDDKDSGDRFRIRIWKKDSEEVVYDNELMAEEGADPTTLITKGAIKVHTPNGKNKQVSLEDNNIGTVTISESNTITAYPNPIQDNGLWINFPAESGGYTYQASIFDFNGKQLVEKTFEIGSAGGSELWNFDHSNWGQGVYLLVLKNAHETIKIQLMKN